MSSETPAGSPPDDSRPLESQPDATLVATVGEAEVSGSTEARAPDEAPTASDDASGPAATEPAVAAAEATPSAEAAPAPASDPATHRFECRSCGFVYDPAEGVRKLAIEAGTPFLDLDPGSFRCPVCRSRVGAFKDIGPRNKPSGFEENLNFGLGVNRLTPGQKNVLIFGAFALAIAFFLSLYSLR
jgi:rubredoxin